MAEDNNKRRPAEGGESAFDWTKIVRRLFRRWKFIVLVTFLFSAFGLFYAFRMQRSYTVTMTLAPELQNRGNSSLSALANMLGGNSMILNSTPDALNISIFPEISSSTPFLCSLFDVPVTPFVPMELVREGVSPDTTTVFLHMLGRDGKLTERQKRKWAEADAGYLYDDSIIDPKELTPRQHIVINKLRNAVTTGFDNKTGITTIRVVMDDPMIAKQLADTVCQRLQDFVTDYRTRKAMDDYNYYVELADEAYARLVKAQNAYAARVDYDRSVILQSVNSSRQRLQDEANLANQLYSQMAHQRELAKAKVQEVKPVYAVVQPAYLPNTPSNSRAKVCVMWFLAGFLISCFWVVFGKDMFLSIWQILRHPDGSDE